MNGILIMANTPVNGTMYSEECLRVLASKHDFLEYDEEKKALLYDGIIYGEAVMTLMNGGKWHKLSDGYYRSDDGREFKDNKMVWN